MNAVAEEASVILGPISTLLQIVPALFGKCVERARTLIVSLERLREARNFI